VVTDRGIADCVVSQRLPKPKVLLADDNFDMREYVARLLAPKYEVISVSNGSLFVPPTNTPAPITGPAPLLIPDLCAPHHRHRHHPGLEALSVLRAHSHAVDLVLTDVMMPFLDGFGLLKEIRYCDRTRMAAPAPHTTPTLTRAR
jgi:CheY-like chemotaxis protein